MEAFRKNLRKWRTLAGLTDAEVARRSSISESRYAHYVSGRNQPDLATLLRIAEALGVTPNVLLGVVSDDTADPALKRAHSALSALGTDDLDLANDFLELLVVRAGKRNGPANEPSPAPGEGGDPP